MTINPNVQIVSYKDVLTKDNISRIYEGVDILVEAFDSADAKAMFAEATISMEIPKVMVSGIAGIGHSDDIRIKKIGKDFYVIGDECSDIGNMFPYAPRVAIAAAKQADVVLSLLLSRKHE